MRARQRVSCTGSFDLGRLLTEGMCTAGAALSCSNLLRPAVSRLGAAVSSPTSCARAAARRTPGVRRRGIREAGGGGEGLTWSVLIVWPPSRAGAGEIRPWPESAGAWPSSIVQRGSDQKEMGRRVAKSLMRAEKPQEPPLGWAEPIDASFEHSFLAFR